jgi:hypothetical protein
MDIEEMRRHVRLIESYFEEESAIAGQVEELSAQVRDIISAIDEGTAAVVRSFVEMREAVDRNTETLERLARRRK